MTLSVEDYNTIIEFLYELPKNKVSYGENLLNLFSKYFHINNSSFFSFKSSIPILSSNTFELDKMDNFFEKSMNPSFNIYNYQAHFEEDPSSTSRHLHLYLQKYSYTSFYSKRRLPEQYKHSTIIRFSDLPDDIYKNTEYYTYLNSINCSYLTILYLYFKEINLGRIVLFKSREQGDFTDRELKIFHILYNHIVYQYKLSLECIYYRKRVDLLGNYSFNLPFGIILLNKDFNIIETNDLAIKFCAQILKNQNSNLPGDRNFSLSKDSDSNVEKLVNIIKIAINDLNRNGKMEFNTDSATYICTISSHISTNYETTIDTYFFINITEKTNSDQYALDKITQLYDLTSRELDIIHLLDKGLSNVQIGEMLFISSHTVKAHLSNIYKKLEVTSRSMLLSKLKEFNQR